MQTQPTATDDVDLSCITFRRSGKGTRYLVRVLVGTQRVYLTCPTLEEAIGHRDILHVRAAKEREHRRERKVRRLRGRQDVVYFVQMDTYGPIKIGRTDKALVERRVGNLQIANPAKLTLLGTLSGGAELEREIHARLARLRIRGEWFQNNDEIHAIVSGKAPWIRGPYPDQIRREAC